MQASPDFNEYLKRLTENAKLSLRNAEGIARGLGSAYVGTEHILLGVLSQQSSIGAKLLETSGITIDRARTALKLTPKSIVVSVGSKGLSEAAKLTLRTSWEIAKEFNQDYCGTEHILYGILIQKNTRANVLLKDMNVDVSEIVTELEQYLNQQRYEYEESGEGKQTKEKRKKGKSALEFFGTDLTAEAKLGRLDPVIGREEELRRVITILSRRNKNNPVLIGEPGVGKTAIAEGLAQRIAKEDVPEKLLDKRVVMLDLAGLIAGTKYRGEFEERLKALMHEITNDSSVLLFIDEMHLLVGAGAAEGSMDAANMLKPVLARGTVRVIGATTIEEYRKNIEKDSALERRFQTIMVEPPTLRQTEEILKGLKPHYEEHHDVLISDVVIEQSVVLSDKYISERYMPDKALDLLDEASASIRISRGKTPQPQLRLIKEIKLVRHRMQESVDQENFEAAARHKTKLAELEETLKKSRGRSQSKLKLTEEDLARTVETMTGIPAQKVIKKEANYLMNLEKTLSEQVIGQKEAISSVAKAIRRNRMGLSDKRRPIGSFVFLGPTGVGKTELARVLAREMYSRKDGLIKIDMSEFSERHTAARLVGAPAGYVGYEDGGQLTDKVRRKPYSLILLDEIEKAHPDIFNMLLQILEDGVLTDAKGRSVDFSNTIVIMTGNIGAESLQKESALGFRAETKKDLNNLDELHESNQERVMSELKQTMRPELINRLDKIIVFRALTNKEAGRVLDLQLAELNQRLAGTETPLQLVLEPSAKKLILTKGYDPHNGVRGLRRALQDEVEDHIAENVLKGNYKTEQTIVVKARKKKLVFEVEGQPSTSSKTTKRGTITK
jgi:ATP-dependent Clp protease ATP-binding subunit ClpC